MDLTYHHSMYSNLKELSQAKRNHQQSVSVVIPALNEAATIGLIISSIKQSCLDQYQLVDEIVVIDGMSCDNTISEAKTAGAKAFRINEIGPDIGCSGKGVALWKSQFVVSGDIILFIDSDITDFDIRFIYGLLGPMLFDNDIMLVKSYYKRPLVIDSMEFDEQGGRVTELLVRPLLRYCVPELEKIIQPLSGEYAFRKEALMTLAFWSGYGVEVGILLDTFFEFGINSIAQVNLNKRTHRNRSLQELSSMANSILQVFLEKLHRRSIITLSDDVYKMIQLRKDNVNGQSNSDIELQPYSNFKTLREMYGNF